ncbi:MAG TPA: mandelate racemase/muconate lactonizing enzyme family protein [bacterium]
MKITAVKAWWLRVPIPEAQVQVSDFGRIESFDTCLVRVETDEGIVGHGESKASVGSGGVYHSLVTTIEKELGPIVIGQDPRNIAGLWERMYNGVRAHYALSRGRVFPILSRRGVTISAISGVDMALWDILGKSLNTPVWQLLGGKCHDRLPAYASGGWAGVEKIGEQLESYVDRGGFRAVKMRVGVMDGDVMTSANRVRAARHGVGDGVDIMVDAHGTFSVTEAKRFCREVAPYRLRWFEEPVTADDKRGCAEIRASTDIPISAGESEFTRFDFRDLAELRAVDIFQPDMAICGGITEGMRIAALAATHQIELAPHLWGGALMFAAGLHICAVSPAAIIAEYSLGPNPMLHELAEEKFPVTDGFVDVPNRPGLGVTVREDFIKRNAVK